MKYFISSLLIVCAVIFNAPIVQAQFSFGIESAFAPKDSYAEVSIPATQLKTIVNDNLKNIDDRDVCLNEKAEGALKGYQADFDGDDQEEMWVLYHAGDAKAGCNVMFVLTPMGNGKYRMFDLMTLPAGNTRMHPIITLDEGVQMYLENTYTLKDGTEETRGTILGYRETTMIILTSWTTKDHMEGESMVYEKIRALFYDMNFDQTKELFLEFNKYSSPARTDKSLTERYVLTLDWVPSNLRYSIYDSTGYDKLLEAEKLASSGRRMLHKKSTAMDGITKIREALDTDPFMTFTRVSLGQYFLTDGKYGDAERTLSMATEIDPTSEKGFMLLGDTYLRLNDLQKAKAAYEKYLSFEPTGRNKRRVTKNLDRITNPR